MANLDHNMIKEKPILFSAPMVRALLAGTKTQTRRLGKWQNDSATELGIEYCQHATRGLIAQATYRAYPGRGSARHAICECPHIEGMKLWVRETWCVGKPFDQIKPSQLEKPTEAGLLAVDYAANEKRIWSSEDQGRWRPSIFMPRWASRIELEVTEVRCQRLQDISEEDAKAEGMESVRNEWMGRCGDFDESLTFKELYEILWDYINGKGAWAKNPWVFAYTFKRIKP